MSHNDLPPTLPKELPLVGREEELERLFRVFGASGPENGLRLMVGEGGVGKSRLTRVLEEEAVRRGWTVLRGRAHPVEQGAPYSIMADAFVPHLQAMDPDTLTVLSRGRAGDLSRLFPALGGAPSADVVGLDPGELRTRLYWTFSSLLERVAKRQSTLVILEDLHWADASSLSLLHFIVRHLGSGDLRILASCTAEDRPRNASLLELERSLDSQGLLETLVLRPFDPQEIEALIKVVFGVEGGIASDFAQHLYAWTRGNAYFVDQTLRSLVEGGQLYLHDGTWLGWEAKELTLPASIRDAVRIRLRDVSPAALETAEVMAAVGRPVRLDALERVVDASAAELATAVEELVRSGAVDETERDGHLLLSFHHPLSREALYRGLSLTRQRLLHGQIAAALEEVYGEDASDHADELAFHLARNPAAEDRGRAARYLALAGEAALDRHADVEGTDYLDAAIKAAEPAVPIEAEELERIQRLLARGLARLGRYDEAREHWSEILARAEARGDRADCAGALRHLGLLSSWQGRHAEALDYFGEARARLPEGDAVLGARIEMVAGIALQQLGRAQESLDRINSALVFAQEAGDDALLGWVHRGLALVYTFRGDTAEAREHAQQALELGRSGGSPRVVFWGQWAMAFLEGLVGGPHPMQSWIAASRISARELGSPVLDLLVDELEVEYLFFSGEWDSALALGTRAIELARSLHQDALLVRLLIWTSSVYIGRGDLEGGERLVAEAEGLVGIEGGRPTGHTAIHVLVPALIGRATLLLANDRRKEALEVAREGLALAEASGYVIWVLHRLLPVIGEVYVYQRDLDLIKETTDRMRYEGDRMDHRVILVYAQAGEALLTWYSGDLEAGARTLEGAAEAMEELGIPYAAARLRRQHAGRLAELGQREKALEALRGCHEVFARLGAGPELQATRGMYEELEKRPPNEAPRGADPRGILSAREWQVAEAVAQRKSNKQIAAALSIGQRTVERHCHNIYKKLDIDGGPDRKRTILGDWVREGRIRTLD